MNDQNKLQFEIHNINPIQKFDEIYYFGLQVIYQYEKTENLKTRGINVNKQSKISQIYGKPTPYQNYKYSNVKYTLKTNENDRNKRQMEVDDEKR